MLSTLTKWSRSPQPQRRRQHEAHQKGADRKHKERDDVRSLCGAGDREATKSEQAGSRGRSHHREHEEILRGPPSRPHFQSHHCTSRPASPSHMRKPPSSRLFSRSRTQSYHQKARLQKAHTRSLCGAVNREAAKEKQADQHQSSPNYMKKYPPSRLFPRPRSQS